MDGRGDEGGRQSELAIFITDSAFHISYIHAILVFTIRSATRDLQDRIPFRPLPVFFLFHLKTAHRAAFWALRKSTGPRQTRSKTGICVRMICGIKRRSSFRNSAFSGEIGQEDELPLSFPHFVLFDPRRFPGFFSGNRTCVPRPTAITQTFANRAEPIAKKRRDDPIGAFREAE